MLQSAQRLKPPAKFIDVPLGETCPPEPLSYRMSDSVVLLIRYIYEQEVFVESRWS